MQKRNKRTSRVSLGLACLLMVAWVPPASATSSDEVPGEIRGTARVRFLPAVSALAEYEVSLLGDADPVRVKKKRRRHSIDIFRHDTHFTFRDNPMVLRVRLRAKKKETMSVELKF